MSEPTKGDPKKRPAQRVDLGASSGPAPWLDDSALVKSLRAQLVAFREALSRAEQRELIALAELDEANADLAALREAHVTLQAVAEERTRLLEESRAELATAKHLNGRWMDEAAQAKIMLELCQARETALRAALTHAENALGLSLLDCEDRGPSGNRCGECLACLRDATLVVVRAALATPGKEVQS